MKIRRAAKDTLTPIEMYHGDTVQFTLANGDAVEFTLLATGAEIVETTLKKPGIPEPAGKTSYRFWGDFEINGTEHRLVREVGTQNSFYEPREISGVRIWLDAVDDIFAFMQETHGPCRPSQSCSLRLPKHKNARLVLQDATLRICPEVLEPWCPLPEGGLKIEDCYRGDDSWLGAYDGASAHGGLDINHPKGTPLFAPIDLDCQFLLRSKADGYVNNTWRGIRRWPNGSEWILLSAHMTRTLVPELVPIRRGVQYAEAAGVWVGVVEHSHFCFSVHEWGDTYLLDPWILFWQMYRDRHQRT